MNNFDGFMSDVASELKIDKKELIAEFQLQKNQNWDSLGQIAVMGFMSEHFQACPDYAEVNNCQTFGDLLKLANQQSDSKG